MNANARTIDLSGTASSSAVDASIRMTSAGGYAPLPAPRIYLFGRPAPGWRFKYPMAVSFQREGGQVIAVDELFDNYGQGRTQDEAVADLKGVLTEFYQLVEQAHDRRSRKLLAHLQTYLDRDAG